MIDIQIDDSDLTDTMEGIADDTDDELYHAMQTSLAWLHDAIATYPAAPAGSRYRRTGNLGRTWTSHITRSAENITGELGNNAKDRRGRSYGPYVQADPSGPRPHQAWFHRGRWVTDQDVVDDNEVRIRALFAEHLDQLVEG